MQPSPHAAGLVPNRSASVSVSVVRRSIPPSSESSLPLWSLVHDSGNYYLQFYDGTKTPKRKRISLGTKRKKVARKLQQKYEEAYAMGEYDPRPGRKLNDPDPHLSVRDALQRF